MPENESVPPAKDRPAAGRKDRIAIWAVVAYLALGFAVFGFLVSSSLGRSPDRSIATFEVTNQGSTPIEVVTLHTCHSDMKVTSLGPGETRSVRSGPCPDSGLQVEVTKAGRTTTSEPDFYVCAGLRISVRVDEEGRATPEVLVGAPDKSATGTPLMGPAEDPASSEDAGALSPVARRQMGARKPLRRPFPTSRAMLRPRGVAGVERHGR